MNNVFDQREVRLVIGAQLLYGGDAVIVVSAHSNEMVNGLNESGRLPVKVAYEGTANSSKEVEIVFKAANNDDKCVGVITWMHIFSPAKTWIHGLQQLKKPLLYLHTQFNKEIPWNTMDMNSMNLNQSVHGDRELGHIHVRMRIRRKVVVGYWKEEETLHKIVVWMRVCAGWVDSQDMLIIRFGNQMNNVTVTDGDEVEAEQRIGYHTDYYPASELMKHHKDTKNADVDVLVATYFNDYGHDASLKDKSTEAYQGVWNTAKAKFVLCVILKAKGAKGFTTNFDDLGQTDGSYFDQISGLASQHLIAEGYRFGAEGDWESAALYRTVWIMNQGLPKGCSFLEDYTLNSDGTNSFTLQSRMLEICPLIAVNKPRSEVHFLGTGIRKSQTARLMSISKTETGRIATVVDMDNRFRLIVNNIECIEPKPFPKLPVISVLWIPMPNFEVGAGAWILVGGTHHSRFSYDLIAEYWEDYAEIAGIEMVHISKGTTTSCFKKELRMNEVYYMLNKALC